MSKDKSRPHKWLLHLQPEAKKAFDALSKSEKQGVFRNLRECLNADDPYRLPFVQMVKAKKFERVRKFRVGNYRVFFAIETEPVTYLKHEYRGTLFLLRIEHRRDAY
jgi:mRNA-degrading endonuclease RelE of RelBE toxin-antitoxin system